jgi:UDP-N-acetylmuramate dehydrogenase
MIQFQENISLKKFNTFGVEARAHYFATVSSLDELKSLIRNFDPGKDKHLITGGGSNLLFTKDFAGWILRNEIRGIEITKNTPEEVYVKAGGGEDWSGFVDFTVEKGWSGLENLSLIPGTVGAAPVQNIGAYGVEQKEAFVELEACNLMTGQISYFNRLECDFGYRNSIFKGAEKGKWFVLNVTYRLRKKPQFRLDYAPLHRFFEGKSPEQITVRAVSEAVKSIRRSKLPDTKKLGNAGSFFKNPVVLPDKFQQLQQQFPDMPFYPQADRTIKIPAGWLIEQAGWKGKRLGNAGVHSQQALVLVNYGRATGKEILALAEAVQNDVLRKFSIRLEPEVLIL